MDETDLLCKKRDMKNRVIYTGEYRHNNLIVYIIQRCDTDSISEGRINIT